MRQLIRFFKILFYRGVGQISEEGIAWITAEIEYLV